MNKNLTDITLVVDRSGSMASIQDDAQGGINTFIKDQKTATGDAVLTLVQFDTEYEFVHKAVAIADVGTYTLNPRGGTALLDAVGRATAEATERLEKVAEAYRPGLVVFVIVTDGHENSSKEFKVEQIKKLIEGQREKGWEFIFLGADEKAFDQGLAMGINFRNVAIYNVQNTGSAYRATSEKILGARSSVSSGAVASMGFTPEERETLKNDPTETTSGSDASTGTT